MSDQPTVLGTLYIGVATLVGLGLVALMAFVGNWIRLRAKSSKVLQLCAVVWEKAQTVVAHVEAELRPDIVKSLADGDVTKDEANQLKARAMTLLKEQLGSQLKELEKALGIFGPAIDIYLSGLLERALGVQRAALTPMVQAVVPPAVSVSSLTNPR